MAVERGASVQSLGEQSLPQTTSAYLSERSLGENVSDEKDATVAQAPTQPVQEEVFKSYNVIVTGLASVRKQPELTAELTDVKKLNEKVDASEVEGGEWLKLKHDKGFMKKTNAGQMIVGPHIKGNFQMDDQVHVKVLGHVYNTYSALAKELGLESFERGALPIQKNTHRVIKPVVVHPCPPRPIQMGRAQDEMLCVPSCLLPIAKYLAGKCGRPSVHVSAESATDVRTINIVAIQDEETNLQFLIDEQGLKKFSWPKPNKLQKSTSQKTLEKSNTVADIVTTQ